MIKIIFDNQNILVLDKPAGLPCLPESSQSNLENSVCEFILENYPKNRDLPDFGLCHRLDNNTSGILICAKNVETYESIRVQIQNGQAKKKYLALINAPIENQIISTPIAHHAKNKAKMVSLSSEQIAKKYKYRGKLRPAQTRIKNIKIIKKIKNNLSLISAEIIGPGARHQIRVHLASIGCPLAGDALYGASSESKLANLPGHALHASDMKLEGFGEFTANWDIEEALKLR